MPHALPIHTRLGSTTTRGRPTRMLIVSPRCMPRNGTGMNRHRAYRPVRSCHQTPHPSTVGPAAWAFWHGILLYSVTDEKNNNNTNAPSHAIAASANRCERADPSPRVSKTEAVGQRLRSLHTGPVRTPSVFLRGVQWPRARFLGQTVAGVHRSDR